MRISRISRICTLVLISAALALVAGADDKPTGKKPTSDGGFERIKSLSGEWDVVSKPGEHSAHGGTVTYKITAGGSAVLETLFGGTDHEMVTLYYMDGEVLTLTHYCMLHNRPLMRAAKEASKDKIAFECQAKDNPDIDAADHMHKAVFTFADADHLKTEWTLYKDGKADSTHSFDLIRKKAKK